MYECVCVCVCVSEGVVHVHGLTGCTFTFFGTLISSLPVSTAQFSAVQCSAGG